MNTVVPIVNLTPNASITCSSNTVVISSTVTPSTTTYTWTGPGIIGNSNSSSIIANSIGTYSLSVTDPLNGCVNNTVTATVGSNTIAPSLSVSTTNSVLTCSSTTSTLSAVSSANNPIWSTPTGTTSSNPLIASAAGDYTATVVDAMNGCSTSQIVTLISNIISPDANAGAATILPCNSPSVTLLGSSTTTDVVSYSWAGPNAGSVLANGNTNNPTILGTGVYTLTVTNLVTGCSATSTVDVSTDNVTASFDADPMSGEITLNVNFTNTSIGANNYAWTFGNGNTSSSTNPSTVYNNAGTYTVVLVASSNNCSDTATKVITVEEGFTLEVPNVFTPNNDGTNDLFSIKSTGVKSAEGYIYNRWGQLLYSWDVLKISWDGKASNGENCPDGTYYYLIKLIDKKDKEHLAPGYVLIAR
jgi:gliding motility-associated-like protein